MIKIPLAPSASIISEDVTKELFALKDNAGLSPVENRAPLRLLLNDSGSDIKQNVPLILSSLYKRKFTALTFQKLISQYIGETEKNLDEIFETAQHKDWILFFVEADALFWKRTDVTDANGKYVNQEVETGRDLSSIRTGRDLSLRDLSLSLISPNYFL